MADPKSFLRDKEIEDLFKSLDINNDNNLTMKEIEIGLKKLKIPHTAAKSIFNKMDIDKDNRIGLNEFKVFIMQQEIKLKDLFSDMDKDGSGKITISEIEKHLGDTFPTNNYDPSSIKKLVKIIDKNGDGKIDFDEWREFLIFIPDMNLEFVMEWGSETAALLFTIQDAPPLQMISENAKKTESSGAGQWLKTFLAGGLSGAISRTLTAPLDRLKILYQVNYTGALKPPTVMTGLKEIYVRDGFKGLFRGNLINVCKATPDTSIKMTVFEIIKSALRKDNEKLSNQKLFLAGASSGVISGFCVFPLDVVKTRLSAAPTGVYSGIMDAVVKISKTEGKVKPFFNGFQAFCLQALPNSGLNLMTYEVLKGFASNLFRKRNRDVPLSMFMCIGAFSAVVSSSMLYPAQVLTSRIIMNGMRTDSEKPSMVGILRNIHATEGWAGFYKGFRPAMSKIVLGNGLSFGAYEVCRKQFGLNAKKK